MSITLWDAYQKDELLIKKIQKELSLNIDPDHLEKFRDNLHNNGLSDGEIKRIMMPRPLNEYLPDKIDLLKAMASNDGLLNGLARTLKNIPEEERLEIIKAMRLDPQQTESLNIRIQRTPPIEEL